MGYSTVLLDFDYTLLDSDASSKAAFRHLMAACGFDDPAEHFPAFEAINMALWRQVEEHTLTPDEVHVSRFEQLSPEIGSPLSPQEMADIYSEGMGANDAASGMGATYWIPSVIVPALLVTHFIIFVLLLRAPPDHVSDVV